MRDSLEKRGFGQFNVSLLKARTERLGWGAGTAAQFVASRRACTRKNG